VTVAAVLAAYAAIAGLAGGSLLRRGRWAARDPLPGIVVWLAATWSVIVATALAGLSLAVDSTAVGTQLSAMIGACIIRLRSAYATPGGIMAAWPGLFVTTAVTAWAVLAAVRYLGTDRRFALRHAEAARLVGRKAPALGAVLLDHAVPAAYSIASRPPTVVVTSAALRALDATQLAAVLAHEQAHLRARHQLLRALARIARRAAPFVPLCRHADEQVATLVELHADDVATRVSGTAPLAAALAILATATPSGPSPGMAPGLSATSADVLARIHRLLRPAVPAGPLRRRLLGVGALALAAGPVLLALLPAMVALALGRVHTALTSRKAMAESIRLTRVNSWAGDPISSRRWLRSMGMTYTDVNGLSLWYDEHGDSDSDRTPLVLLHGGLGSGETWVFGPAGEADSVLGQLTRGRRVITADLQGHGRTADIARPLRYETMADDIAALIRHLAIPQADVMGYSLGGGTALRLAIQHPDLVRRLVVVSQPHKLDGWYPEVRAGFQAMGSQLAEPMKQSPIYQAYEKVAPRPEDWPVLLDKIGDAIRQPYDWSAEIATIAAPAMLVFGDADSVSPAQIAEFYSLVGGGQRDGNWDGSLRPAARLAILPGRVHTDMFLAPELGSAVTGFLDATALIPPPIG